MAIPHKRLEKNANTVSFLRYFAKRNRGRLSASKNDASKELSCAPQSSVRESLCVEQTPSQSEGVCSTGTPEGIRTPDPLVRSQILYPAELQARTVADNSNNSNNYNTFL